MSEYQWFVEVPGPGNEVVARMLASEQRTEESAHVGMKDVNGNPHNVWEVEYRFVAELFLAAREFHFRFKVFNRANNTLPLREVTSLVRGWVRGKAPAAVRSAKEELEALAEKKSPPERCRLTVG